MQSFDSPIVQPLAFFADVMLGRLTRWLRMLGYDTAYEKVLSDESLTSRESLSSATLPLPIAQDTSSIPMPS